MMKYFFAVLLALLFAGCTKKTTIDFTGTVAGIENGQFRIKSQTDSILCQADIKSGKFAVTIQMNAPGYYYMEIIKTGEGSQVFDVYLEPGTYAVVADAKTLYKYPVIKGTSKKQNELTAYYKLAEKVNDELFQKAQSLNNQYKDSKAKLLPPATYTELAAQVKEADTQASRSGGASLLQFVKEYPDNEVAMHLMLSMDYQGDPVTFYKVYKKLSPGEKSSNWGKVMGPLLDSLAEDAQNKQ